MGFWSALFGDKKSEGANKKIEHAVLVHLRLSDDSFGTEEERTLIHQLSDKLQSEIEQRSVGEFDGDEFGEGRCMLFMYGPDADRLFEVIEPILRSSPLSRGGYAIKRHGNVDDPNAREERIEF